MKMRIFNLLESRRVNHLTNLVREGGKKLDTPHLISFGRPATGLGQIIHGFIHEGIKYYILKIEGKYYIYHHTEVAWRHRKIKPVDFEVSHLSATRSVSYHINRMGFNRTYTVSDRTIGRKFIQAIHGKFLVDSQHVMYAYREGYFILDNSRKTIVDWFRDIL